MHAIAHVLAMHTSDPSGFPRDRVAIVLQDCRQPGAGIDEPQSTLCIRKAIYSGMVYVLGVHFPAHTASLHVHLVFECAHGTQCVFLSRARNSYTQNLERYISPWNPFTRLECYLNVQLSVMQRSEPSTSKHPTSPSPLKTRRGEVDEQIAARAQAKIDVADKSSKTKEITKARAAANAKAQKQMQRARDRSTVPQAQKKARMHHSINSLRDGISVAWTDKHGMHTCNDERELVPKTLPELDKRQQAVVSGAFRPLLMPGNDQAFFSNEMRRMSEQDRLA
jgi:hypothetical protein